LYPIFKHYKSFSAWFFKGWCLLYNLEAERLRSDKNYTVIKLSFSAQHESKQRYNFGSFSVNWEHLCGFTHSMIKNR